MHELADGLYRLVNLRRLNYDFQSLKMTLEIEIE